MPRSKSGSEGQRKIHHRSSSSSSSSVFARSFSSSIFCRGDSIGAQIDPKALIKPIDNQNSHADSSENGIHAIAVADLEDELRRTKEKLTVTELELRDAKAALLAASANSRSSEEEEEVDDLMEEVDELRKTASEKDRRIESLEMEAGKLRELEGVLAEKEEFISRLNKELRELKDREKGSMAMLSESKKRAEELEVHVKRRKESESKMADALASKKKELEKVQLQLQETRTEVATLREKIASLESLCGGSSSDDDDDGDSGDLKAKLKSSRGREKAALSRVEALEDELDLLKSEWRKALNAEQSSAAAMEELAVALAEVAAEAKQANEKFSEAEEELERVWNLVKEAQQEAEMHKNSKERLRLEVEETLLALTAKEMSFVGCVKRAEEEKAAAVLESSRLAEALLSAEKMARAAREETFKSRDLLKQALNEANAAKAAAALAQDENSNLKDTLTGKEETLRFLMEENERLRMSEVEAQEKVKKLKTKLKKSGSSEIDDDDKDLHETPRSNVSSDDSHKGHGNGKKKDEYEEDLSDGLTINLNKLNLMNEPEDLHLNLLDGDPEKADALKGSIFDMSAVTPKSEPHTPSRSFSKNRRRRYSFSYTEIKEGPNSEAFYTSEYDYPITTKPTHRRVKTMFRRVGGLLAIRRGSSRKEALPSPSPSQSPSQSSVE